MPRACIWDKNQEAECRRSLTLRRNTLERHSWGTFMPSGIMPSGTALSQFRDKYQIPNKPITKNSTPYREIQTMAKRNPFCASLEGTEYLFTEQGGRPNSWIRWIRCWWWKLELGGRREKLVWPRYWGAPSLKLALIHKYTSMYKCTNKDETCHQCILWRWYCRWFV